MAMFGQLPPGLRGMLAAQQMREQSNAGQLQQLGGILGLRNQMAQQEQAAQDAPLHRQLLEAQVGRATAPPPPRQVDLGDRIGFIDQAGNLVGAIPKAATPDATLRESGADRRHTQPSGGNLLADERARSEGALNRGVTIAGMNRPVFNEAAGGFVVPPPVGAPTGRPAGGVMGGAPMVGGNGPRIPPAGSPVAAPAAPQVIPVPGLGGGKAPTGYRFTQDGNLEAIPGGPADAKAGAAADKATLRENAALSRADLVIGKVDKALDQAGFFSTGLMGAATGVVPNTAGYNLQKTLDTVIGNIGFQELQAMREASPTGGALGQVAVKELEMLQSVIGSLDKGQSEPQLRENLMKVGEHFQNWKNAVRQSRGLPAEPNKYGASGKVNQIPGQGGGGRTQPRVVVDF